MNQLDSLRASSIVVADTGDIEAIARFRPRDATTNPSLLLQAAQIPAYSQLVDDALAYAARVGRDDASRAELALEKLAVNFGTEVLRHVEGRVSTEVDAALSFDMEGTLRKANRLMELYAQCGVAPERVLVKIASTWEGIRAASRLEREDIRCNLTLLFGFGQAAACADAGVTLVSPFVGRIYDWHRAARHVDDISADADPGVASVRRIYDYFKKHGYRTEVMAASFRKAEQVLHLAGCDLLTISPELLAELAASSGTVARRLSPESAGASHDELQLVTEARFRWLLNEDEMASDKLAEGIRRFHLDTLRLTRFMRDRLATSTSVPGAISAEAI